MTYSVAIIGTGADPDERDREGFAMAYRHAPGYQRLRNCELVACVDIVRENAETFAENFDLDSVYMDHQAMLRETDPDVASICVPPAVHAEIVIDCARSGALEAIHCEKPMATTWRDCREMVAACEEEDVQLTIGHQRRFARPVTEAKRLIDRGEIGEIRRFEWSEANLYDAGSHLFDLCDYLLDGVRPTWALAAVDVNPDNEWFGSLNASRAVAQWAYDDGTLGLASTAESGETAVDVYLRVVGEEGKIEIGPDDGPPLRLRTGDGWRTIGTGGESIYGPGLTKIQAATNKVGELVPGISPPNEPGPSHYERAIEHLITALREGSEPIISGRRVLRGTELVFACWESARRRQRVEVPIAVEGNPLEDLCAEQFDLSDGDGMEGSGRSSDTGSKRLESRTDGDDRLRS